MALGLGSNGEEHPSRFSPAAWGRVGLEVSALDRVADQVFEQFADAQRSFLPEGIAA
jgi:hypothetical protein